MSWPVLACASAAWVIWILKPFDVMKSIVTSTLFLSAQALTCLLHRRHWPAAPSGPRSRPSACRPHRRSGYARAAARLPRFPTARRCDASHGAICSWRSLPVRPRRYRGRRRSVRVFTGSSPRRGHLWRLVPTAGRQARHKSAGKLLAQIAVAREGARGMRMQRCHEGPQHSLSGINLCRRPAGCRLPNCKPVDAVAELDPKLR